MEAAPDADHCAVGELVREDRLHDLAVRIVGEVERLVAHHPFRTVEKQPRQRQSLLLAHRQFGVPALHTLERLRQMLEADAVERRSELLVGVVVGVGGASPRA